MNSLVAATRVDFIDVWNDHIRSEQVNLKICVHEAAHAVAARHFGIPVKWVSFDPEFIMRNPLAIQNGCAGGAPVCMSIASHVLSPILERGQMMTKSEKQIVFDYGVQVLAGPLAEWNLDPNDYHPEAAGGDMLQISSVLHCVERRGYERRRLLAAMRKAAIGFVHENQQIIRAFAEILLTRKTILEHEIDELIEWSASTYKQAA